MVDCWADPVAHLLLLKSSMAVVIDSKKDKICGFNFASNLVREVKEQRSRLIFRFRMIFDDFYRLVGELIWNNLDRFNRLKI